MEELLTMLLNEPEKLVDFRAAPEAWHGAPEAGSPLKLFQPGHQRYYLVATNLVCRIPGLPDRVVESTREEKTSFVLRRWKPIIDGLGPPSPDNLQHFDEYAFVIEGESGTWKWVGRVSEPTTKVLETGEEQLPLFGVSYLEDKERKRRLLAGLVPVGKYEAYIGAQVQKEIGTSGNEETEPDKPLYIDETNDARMALFHTQVVVPWRSLIGVQETTIKRLGTVDELTIELSAAGLDSQDSEYIKAVAEFSDQEKQTDRQIQMASWYILLDLHDFIETYQIKDVVLAELRETGALGVSFADSLQQIAGFRDQLEGATLAYSPRIGSALAYPPGVEAEMAYTASTSQVTLTPGWPQVVSLTDAGIGSLIDEDDEAILISLIAEALKDLAVQDDTPALPLAAQQAALAGKDDLGQDVWFVIRCVFDRPRCVGQARTLVSEATQPFQMASFFDPEAPSRPVRISLPLDTSPAGLRKFSKNTALVLSDVIACQIGQVRGITLGDLVLSVLPWPFHKPLPDPEPGACSDLSVSDGLVCSLSIPIVTICALILLIIIVQVFDYLFRWVPYLMACFKLPGLKGKGKA